MVERGAGGFWERRRGRGKIRGKWEKGKGARYEIRIRDSVQMMDI